jgi:hypothetical protein
MKFSREPAVWVGVAGGVLTFAASLGFDFLDAGAAAAITALISGVVMAVFTRPVAPALAVGVVSAAASVAAEYGFHWSDAQVGSAGALILSTFAAFMVRPQVDPTTSGGRVIEGTLVRSATVPR